MTPLADATRSLRIGALERAVRRRRLSRVIDVAVWLIIAHAVAVLLAASSRDPGLATTGARVLTGATVALLMTQLLAMRLAAAHTRSVLRFARTALAGVCFGLAAGGTVSVRDFSSALIYPPNYRINSDDPVAHVALSGGVLLLVGIAVGLVAAVAAPVRSSKAFADADHSEPAHR